MGPTYVVAKRVARQVVRDRRTLALLVLQPLIIISIFGYAFSGDVRGAAVVVANLDRGGFAEEVLAHLDTETVDVRRVSTEAAAEEAVRRAEVSLAVVFPANFTRNLESGGLGGDRETAYLVLYKDNTNLQVTSAAQKAFADALVDALEARTDSRGAFVLDERVVFGSEDGESLDFFVPGVAAYSIFMLGAMLTVVAIVKERTSGTLARLLASPLQRGEIVGGYVLTYTALSVVQAAIVLGISTFVFGVDIQGSFLLALLTTTLVGFVALGLGILVSGVSTSEYQAMQGVFFVAFPSLFLAGIFAPLEAMPPLLRPAAALIPLSYAVHAMRDVINHGAGLAQILPDLLALSAFALLFLAGATMSFAKRA
jgi:ABC-2 type transport system permease protein